MTSPYASPSQIDAFLKAAHEVAARRLVLCSSGNLSRRLDNGVLMVTASRSWMETLTADQIAYCRIEDGSLLEGPRPSVETLFHAGILRQRPEVNVVLHFQSPYATVVACRRDFRSLNYHVTPEMPYYMGDPGFVPFLMPGSAELAEAVIAAATAHAMVILQNHGQVTVGATDEEAIQRAVFFEMTCGILVQAGERLNPLSPADAGALIDLGGHGGKA